MYNLKFVEQKCDATNWGINSFSNPLVETQIHFYFLNAWAAQTAQTEEFVFQNVAYRSIVCKKIMPNTYWTYQNVWYSGALEFIWSNIALASKTKCALKLSIPAK